MPYGKAYVDGKYLAGSSRKINLADVSIETFWVDLTLHNPLEVEVNLSNVTIVAQEMKSSELPSTTDFVEIESIEDIILGAKETQPVSYSISLVL
jgi:hypothetical protein